MVAWEGRFQQSRSMNDTFYKSLFLIDCETLAGQLDDPGLKIFDCTQRLVRDPKLYVRAEPCKTEYAEAHIPGAGYLDILAELSDRSKRWRYMMPAVDVLAGAFAKRGIGKDTRVVLYDTDGMMWSTRVWWQLHAIGFDNAAVLDGGLGHWRALGHPVSDAPCTYVETDPIPVGEDRNLLVDHKAVLDALEVRNTAVVNALTREQFCGGGITYGRPGRISGSVNVPARELTDKGTGTLKPAADLQRLFDDAGVDLASPVLCYCGGGIAATLDAFVLTLLGAEDVTVYDASMQEWALDDNLPMETG